MLRFEYVRYHLSGDHAFFIKFLQGTRRDSMAQGIRIGDICNNAVKKSKGHIIQHSMNQR